MFKLRVRYEALRLRGKDIVDLIKEDAYDTAKAVVAVAKAYPPVPPRPPNRYYRTGHLGASWWVGRPYQRANTIGVELGNRAYYFDVVSGEDQWELHAAHGWEKLSTVLLPFEQDFLNKVEKRIYSEFS